MTGGTSPTVFLVGFVVYIAVMIFIGWYSSRGKSEGTDYLTGGRGLNLLMIFGTIGATMIGTGSSMGAISNGFRSGWGGSTYGLGCCLALVIIGLLFSGLREKNFITMSEEAQYYFDGSSSVRKLTGILTFIAEWIFIASSINGGAKYLQFLTGHGRAGLQDRVRAGIRRVCLRWRLSGRCVDRRHSAGHFARWLCGHHH